MSDTAPVAADEKENLPAVPGDMMDTGLEDFETSDMVMPRLGIEHSEGVLVDNLTGQKFSSLEVVMLGLIKQRILWDTDIEEGDTPLCKSYNFREGVPGKEFPWDASGFDQSLSNDTLPCDSCKLKDWGSHPQRDTPWCSEQHTFPLLLNVAGKDEEPNFAAPAIFTTQRSGLKSSKSYLTGFARKKSPLFTVVTRITLEMNKRGNVTYSVPKYTIVEDTDQSEWPAFSDHYRQIREFVTTRPAKEEDTSPADAPANKHGDDDDDVPF